MERILILASILCAESTKEMKEAIDTLRKEN